MQLIVGVCVKNFPFLYSDDQFFRAVLQFVSGVSSTGILSILNLLNPMIEAARKVVSVPLKDVKNKSKIVSLSGDGVASTTMWREPLTEERLWNSANGFLRHISNIARGVCHNMLQKGKQN